MKIATLRIQCKSPTLDRIDFPKIVIQFTFQQLFKRLYCKAAPKKMPRVKVSMVTSSLSFFPVYFPIINIYIYNIIHTYTHDIYIYKTNIFQLSTSESTLVPLRQALVIAQVPKPICSRASSAASAEFFVGIRCGEM